MIGAARPYECDLGAYLGGDMHPLVANPPPLIQPTPNQTKASCPIHPHPPPSIPRPRLKGLQYDYARHLERCGDLKGAVQYYELAGVAGDEVPRLMMTHGKGDELERWVWLRFA